MGGEANIGAGCVGGIKRPVSEVSSYYRVVPKKSILSTQKRKRVLLDNYLDFKFLECVCLLYIGK